MDDSLMPRTARTSLGKWLLMLLVLSALGLATALVSIALPQDVSDLDGTGKEIKAVPARDLQAVLRNALDGGYALTLTEAEINQWLGRSLVARQGGALANHVTLDRVWVRLEDSRAEVVMARRIMGYPFTISMYLQVQQLEGPSGVHTEVLMHGGPYGGLARPPRGGRFGRLVVPQGFLLLVLPAYEKLAALFPDEIHLAFEEMARVQIESGRLVLNPRPPTSEMSELPQAF